MTIYKNNFYKVLNTLYIVAFCHYANSALSSNAIDLIRELFL